MEEKRRSIDEELFRAYQNTVYRVLDPPVALRIGQLHPALDAWLASRSVGCWAFLTAANPRSRPLDAADNQRRMDAMSEALTEAGYPFRPARGEGASGDWPPEPSWLVLNMDRKAAQAWALRYEQLGYVWGETGRVAELVLTGLSR